MSHYDVFAGSVSSLLQAMEKYAFHSMFSAWLEANEGVLCAPERNALIERAASFTHAEEWNRYADSHVVYDGSVVEKDDLTVRQLREATVLPHAEVIATLQDFRSYIPADVVNFPADLSTAAELVQRLLAEKHCAGFNIRWVNDRCMCYDANGKKASLTLALRSIGFWSSKSDATLEALSSRKHVAAMIDFLRKEGDDTF